VRIEHLNSAIDAVFRPRGIEQLGFAVVRGRTTKDPRPMNVALFLRNPGPAETVAKALTHFPGGGTLLS
jgi:hypothetical protein